MNFIKLKENKNKKVISLFNESKLDELSSKEEYKNFLGIDLDYKRNIDVKDIYNVLSVFINVDLDELAEINKAKIDKVINIANKYDKSQKFKTLLFTLVWKLIDGKNKNILVGILDNPEYNKITVLTQHYKEEAKRAKYRRSAKKKNHKKNISKTKRLNKEELNEIISTKEYIKKIRTSLSNKENDINISNFNIIIKDIYLKVEKTNSEDKSKILAEYISCLPFMIIGKGQLQESCFNKFNLDYESYNYWSHIIKTYIKSRKLVQEKEEYRIMGSLISYISIYLPIARHLRLTDVKLPKLVDDFIGSYFVSSPLPVSLKLPLSLLDFVDIIATLRSNEKNKANYNYWVLSEIKNLFEFVISRKESLGIKNSFSNPILSSDLPRVTRRQESNKVRFPSEAFWTFYSYTHKIIELINKINNSAINNLVDTIELSKIINPKGKLIDANILSKFLDIDLSIEVNGKKYKIKRIRKEVLSSAIYNLKNGSIVELIHPAPITQIATSLETGLRHQSIQWLSNDFDSRVPKTVSENDLYEFFVKVDKVKQSSWYAFVSGRIINMLRDIRTFNNLIDSDMFNKDLPYDNHGKKWGYYNILMNFNVKTGMPHSDGVYSNRYKALLFGVDDLIQEMGIEYSIFETNEDKENLNCESTPHSTRVMVVSELVNHLPPEYISRYITGHSVATVSYYTKINDSEIAKLKDCQSDEFKQISNGTKFNEDMKNANIKANNVNSELVKSFELDPVKASKDFGCASMINDSDNWEKLLESDTILSFSYESTHVCPFAGICPKSIIGKSLYQRCTLCPYAIRSVDHLPAICAARRTLLERIEGIEVKLKAGIKSNKERIKYQDKRKELAEDLAAYSIVRQILQNNLKTLKVNSSDSLKYFAFKPKAIRDDIQEGLFSSINDNESYILDRMEELEDFPDLESKEIKSKVSMMTAKILAATGNIREIIKGDIFAENGLSYSYSLIKSLIEINGYNKVDLLKIASIDSNDLDNNLILKLGNNNAK